MATVAKIGHGSTFSLDDGLGVMTPLAEILGVALPDDVAETVEATHMGSPNKRREYIGGMIDSGEGEVGMNYDGGSATDVLIRGAFGQLRDYEVTVPATGGSWKVSGECIIIGYGRDIPIDDRMVSTVRVKFSGEATEAAAV